MKSFKVVYIYGKVITAITYTSSFYSLKSIMRDNLELTNVYPNSEINISELKVAPVIVMRE